MYDEFLANTSDNEDNDESSTEMENDFNLPEPKNKPILDPRGSRRPGQAPIFRPGNTDPSGSAKSRVFLCPGVNFSIQV